MGSSDLLKNLQALHNEGVLSISVDEKLWAKVMIEIVRNDAPAESHIQKSALGNWLAIEIALPLKGSIIIRRRDPCLIP